VTLRTPNSQTIPTGLLRETRIYEDQSIIRPKRIGLADICSKRMFGQS
jgi:hypothetical protein